MIRILTLSLAAGLLLVACAEDSPVTKTPLTIPAAYDTTTYATNATEELAMNAALTSLSDVMKTANKPGVELSMMAMTDKMGALRSLVTATYGAEVDAIFLEASKASGDIYDPDKLPAANGEGGVLVNYLLDEHGADLGQWVEKGMFIGMQYNQAMELLKGDVTQADIDGVIALFGAHASFKNSNAAKHAPNQDRYSAGYTARRDANDGNGMYTKFRDAVIKLQAAVKAGANYNTERDEAIMALRTNWEKGVIATSINYGFEVITKLSVTSPSDSIIASGAHSFGEMVGFLRGFRGATPKIITDAQVETQLGLLKAPVTGTPTMYEYWQNPATALPAINQVIKNLQAVYGFTDTEIEDFKKNWVTAQSR